MVKSEIVERDERAREFTSLHFTICAKEEHSDVWQSSTFLLFLP